MSDWNVWLDDYFKRFSPAFEPDVYDNLKAFRELAIDIRSNGNKMMFAGNGASASISSHGAVDFTKQGKVRSMDFNENWMARAPECYADKGDAVVLTSVSGTSPNVIKAAEYARDNGLKIVTFSGKSPDNPLRAIGDVNFWIGSSAYNVVEAVHMLWMTTVVDMVVGKAEYSVN